MKPHSGTFQLKFLARKWKKLIVLMVAMILLAGCASTPPAPVEDRSMPSSTTSSKPPSTLDSSSANKTHPKIYRVVAGDTLYGIAFKHDLDYLDIARWNHITPPYRIYVGQELRLSNMSVSTSVAHSGVNESDSSEPVSSAPAKSPSSPTEPTTDSTEPGNSPVFEFVEDQPPSPDALSSTPKTSPSTQTDTQSTVVPKSNVPPASNASEASNSKSEENSVSETPKSETIKSTASTSNVSGIAWRWPSSGPKLNSFVAGDQVRQGIDIGGRVGDPVLAAADGTVVYSGNGLLGYGELIIIKHNSTFLSAYGYNRKRLVQEGETVKAGQTVAEMGSNGANRDMLHFEIRKNGKPVDPINYLPRR